VQQSARSVESLAEDSAACEQHGIRVHKPMIDIAGARAAMIRTIAKAKGFRFIRLSETPYEGQKIPATVSSLPPSHLFFLTNLQPTF